MIQLTKEQLRELYKERDEALFFDYKPIKAKRNFIKPNKIMLDKLPEVFNHYISTRFLGAFGSFNREQIQSEHAKKLNKKSFSSKQVVIKTLSNLDKNGAKNALSYVIRNSDTDFAIMQDGKLKSLKEIMNEWSKDFTGKKNAKEVLHLAFCIDETGGEYNQMRLKNAVEAVMQKNFFLYKYAMVLHAHQSKPHIHILINKNNIIDGQKFHLNNAEFKLFFNQLRNDFAQALNSQGFEYHNRYKIEKDLSRIQSQINQNAFISKRNVLDELTQLQLSVDKKIKAKQKKINESKENLKELYAKQKEIIAELTRLKNIDIKHKGIWQVLKDLKENSALIKDKKATMSIIDKELKGLRADFNKFDYQKLILRHDENQEFSTLLQKKKYLAFITENLDRKTLTKSEINLKIREIERDIALSEQSANEMIKERIKASLLTSSLLGKDNNAFHLTRAYTELTQNLELLKQSDMDKEYYADYQKRLENNQSIILDLITQRFLLLHKELETKKQSKKLKVYQVREYEKASKFLNKDNALEIEKLYKLIDEINSSGGGVSKTQHIQGGGKANEKENSQNAVKSEINQSTAQDFQTQSAQNNQQNALNTQNQNTATKASDESAKSNTAQTNEQSQNLQENSTQKLNSQEQTQQNTNSSQQTQSNSNQSTKKSTDNLQNKMQSSGFTIKR